MENRTDKKCGTNTNPFPYLFILSMYALNGFYTHNLKCFRRGRGGSCSVAKWSKSDFPLKYITFNSKLIIFYHTRLEDKNTGTIESL